MLGLAQKSFLDKRGKLSVKNDVRWPFIQRMLDIGQFDFIDFALAEYLVRDYPDADQDVAAFLCHLSLAAREGHLCIKVEANCVLPDPAETINSYENTEQPSPISSDETQQLTQLIIQGSQRLPEGLVMSESNLDRPIYHAGNLFYLQKYWQDETLFLKNFQLIKDSEPFLILDKNEVSNRLSELKRETALLEKQEQAVLAACKYRFMVISGGPGTGKTYTAGHLIRFFWESLNEKQRERCEIALAAPTGKAAANLQRSLGKAMNGLEGMAPIKAKTLHTLLDIRSSKSNKEERASLLSADLILIDESSMIDVHLMAALFAAIKPGARLILLGDPHQLPPVGAGMVFSNIIELLKQQNPNQITELDVCLRADLQEIVDFAKLINSGDFHATSQFFKRESEAITHHSLSTHSHTAQKAILDHALPFFIKIQKENHPPEQLLEEFNRFRVLTPLRQGPIGVEALNALFVRDLMRRQPKEGWFSAPIMITHNDYRQDLSNGEVGVLIRRMRQDQMFLQGDYALFQDRHNGSIRRLPALLLPKFEYAYCLSVHKSQGSEFDHVLMLMPQGSEAFGREVMYTAATRARKKLEVWTQENVLQNTITKKSHRLGGFAP